ncbi:MAG: sugar transferase [Ignavibacteria bacterium]|nr:sugar transferase [Ignavibacteria bacterium]
MGPRPDRPFFVEQLKAEVHLYPEVMVRPGITGWAQAEHKYNESIDDANKETSARSLL